jgi:hypothetical protein
LYTLQGRRGAPFALAMGVVLRWFFRGVILVFILVELAVIAAAIFAPDIMIGGSNVQETRYGMLAGGVIALVITVGRFARKDAMDELSESLEKQTKAKRDREKQVQSAGLPAQAFIVARENEREDEGTVDLDLTLEIRMAGRAPYRVQYLWSEPERRVAERTRLGRELEARVDPADPSFVVVRWDNGRWYSTRRL